MSIKQRLQKNLLLADMQESPKQYLLKSLIPSTIFTVIISVIGFFALLQTEYTIYTLLIIPVAFMISMWFMLQLPAINAQTINKKIESDLFWPSRMLVTLLESGDSLPTAFERVSRTKTISGNYFAKLAAEIELGKSTKSAVEDAIRYTPSKSFRRVLEPIKNSLRTGASIEENLLATLDDLTKEKIVEIEKYEKRLAPVSMFYMIFGAIIPTFAVVGVVVLLSVAGINVTFFPFLFILLIFVTIVQILFYQLFKKIRPLVQL